MTVFDALLAALRDAAELFQQRVKQEPLPGRSSPRLEAVPEGTCILFTDGLRYDVGQKLKDALEAKLGPVAVLHQFAALPSVTDTGKPAVSPVAFRIEGTTVGEDFRPCVRQAFRPDILEEDPGQPGKADVLLTTERFRKLLEDDGYQVLDSDDVGKPMLMPVSSRKQLNDLSDDIATKVTVVYYNDSREALIKAIAD